MKVTSEEVKVHFKADGGHFIQSQDHKKPAGIRHHFPLSIIFSLNLYDFYKDYLPTDHIIIYCKIKESEGMEWNGRRTMLLVSYN